MGVLTHECPHCEGRGECMGKLAKWFSFRCRHCGATFQVHEDKFPNREEDEDD